MGSGIGIGGLSVGKDEYATDYFDLFKSNAWYAYKAYFENHLSYSKSTKFYLLSYRGYYNDTCDKFDDVGSVSSGNPTESANKGFIERKKIFAGSKWVYF